MHLRKKPCIHRIFVSLLNTIITVRYAAKTANYHNPILVMNSIDDVDDDSHDGEDAYGHDDDDQDDDDEVMIKSAQPRVLIFPGSASTLELSFSGFLPDFSENFTKCAFLRIPS